MRLNDSPVHNLIWFQQKKVMIEGYIKLSQSLPDNRALQNELNTLADELKNFGSEMMK